VTGWLGDFFRFWWALFYWNARKTWFRVRGAHRDDCPCQTYSDSGHALDSRCEAVIGWQRPARFRRVCPLLTETPQGWRCGVDAESVRPFWGRALLQVVGGVIALYLAGTLAVYGLLRAAHYETSYLAVVWPPRWGELRASQEKLYAIRAQQALQAGKYQEAILSLEMVVQLNPRNYAAGLALAGLSQVAAQPLVADHIYERLMRDVPDQRRQTAQIWFRNLLARAAYPGIQDLATKMLNEDPEDRTAWLNALLFACRQTGDPDYLGTVLAQNPRLPGWCTELIGIEQHLLQKHPDRALPWLTRMQRQPAAGYIPYYQVDRLLRCGEADQAGDLLRAYGNQFQPDETVFLRLRLYHAKGWTQLIGPEFVDLLRYEMAPRIVAQSCAYLISHPDPVLFARYIERFNEANLPVDTGTLPLYQATYLAAILSGDTNRAQQIATLIDQFTGSDARVLRGLGDLLRGRAPDPRLPRILPLVPLPTEVVYAILELPVAASPAK
jgi:tetratricopeptide (TPR) repeat protein